MLTRCLLQYSRQLPSHRVEDSKNSTPVYNYVTQMSGSNVNTVSTAIFSSITIKSKTPKIQHLSTITSLQCLGAMLTRCLLQYSRQLLSSRRLQKFNTCLQLRHYNVWEQCYNALSLILWISDYLETGFMKYPKRMRNTQNTKVIG